MPGKTRIYPKRGDLKPTGERTSPVKPGGRGDKDMDHMIGHYGTGDGGTCFEERCG
jgi:hypothetical protein